MMNTPYSRQVWLDRAASFLFWSWNLIFLAFMTLGFSPRILPDLIVSVRTNAIPVQFLFYALVLTSIPIVAVVLGLTVLRRAPRRLVAVGYVVEGPLMLMLAVRFFIIRQATLGLAIVMGIAVLGMAAFLWAALYPHLEERRPLWGWLRLFGLTLMLLTSLYAAVWIAFYAVPITAAALKWVGNTLSDLPAFFYDFRIIFRDLTSNLIWLPFTLLGFILLFYTATLFVLTPLAIPLLSLRFWLKSYRSLSSRFGKTRPAVLVTTAFVGTLVIFFFANHQPQQRVFELLGQPPASLEQAQALLKQEKQIRAGLLNAYLSPFRYISAAGEVEHVSMLYRTTFGFGLETAYKVQRAYERVASPLLYSPVTPPDVRRSQNIAALVTEPEQAARVYQGYFDEPIVAAERDVIVRAVRSTWSVEQAEDAWQAVDDREVHLLQQEISIQEHGDWAEIELYEVYQNQTAIAEEVVYYFNLPESAVLTGLWLGNSPDRDERFVYQVAPRGAAQTVYRNEVRRNQDPALLEQIGPRQYRLRVFPIPAVRFEWNVDDARRTLHEAAPLYLWMTYRTLVAGDSWPTPRLAEKRNIYWDENTSRKLNGAPYEIDSDEWLPAAIPTTSPVVPQTHRVDLPGGISVLAIPEQQVTPPKLPQPFKVAIVLDRSRSMQTYAEQVDSTLTYFQEQLDSDFDIYLTSSPFRGEEPQQVSMSTLELQDLFYFGGQNPAQILAQFMELSAGSDYDAILVLTDGSGYELGPASYSLPVPEAPVWMVHLESDLPLGYDDGTLEAIQASGGGVTGSIEQALQRLAFSLAADSIPLTGEVTLQDSLDGYVWQVLPRELAEVALVQAVSDDEGFLPFAVRRLILAEMQRNRGELNDLEVLDSLHALAEEYSVVSPYSSMIVLVNSLQQMSLDQMERAADRFEREYEAVGGTVPPTQLPLGGVPEPHEWLLLGLAAAFLIYYARVNKLVLNPFSRRN
jgi:putative PEP-CTERM system integral membrane protein